MHTQLTIRRLAPVEHRRELSYIINTMLRNDDEAAAPHLAVIVRSINTLLVTRRGDLELLRFPPRGVTYRGGGLPDEHKDFYKVDKVFRVAGFLATSFLQSKAEDFMCMADERGES
jgi:hypothetical protein